MECEQGGKLHIVVEGCAHGELDNIYASIQRIESDRGIRVDLLICCGDFEAMRSEDDLPSLAVPAKYRHLNSFHKYYSGEKAAPVLTIFIGGNHEASNYMQELNYGGWAAPNMYYLGTAGAVTLGGLRIAGLSGIYKAKDYRRGRHERPPYDPNTLRSVYHVREYEVYKLAQLTGLVDIFLSHDWPQGIEQFGDTDGLIRAKPFFAQEIRDNSLGSPAGMTLLRALKPRYWFSGHLHVKFAGIVPHDCGHPTRFLALDKCLPRREFLQLITLDRPDGETGPPQLMYDLEWLAIVKATHSLLSPHSHAVSLPQESKRIDEAAKAWVLQRLEGDLTIPHNFTVTARTSRDPPSQPRGSGQMIGNPQTDAFLGMLELQHVVTVPWQGVEGGMQGSHGELLDASPTVEDVAGDPNEIDFDHEGSDSRDPNEIDLDVDDDEEDEPKEADRQDCGAAVSDPAAIDIDIDDIDDNFTAA
ncbi:unnamed protein product [Chrysoparadoxa australica]